MLQGCQLTVGLRNGHHAPQLKIEKVNQAPVKRKQNFKYNNYKVYVGNPLNWTWSGENYETMSKS